MWYFKITILLLAFAYLYNGQSQTVYEYFTDGGITEGLRADNRDYFTLNGKPMKIFSGSLHYFRVHPDLWRDRLRKYRAAGLNAVDVYVPWNLHEPERGVFDFGDGGRDMSAFLDLPRFLQMVQEEDMFVMFRPGPYICGEWEFGGLPSWLLGDHPMFVRTSHQPYQERAGIFISEVVSRVRDLQFYTASGNRGGPIIMAQIENEYGNFGYTDWPRDKDHLRYLRDVMVSSGIESLLFTSDSPHLTRDEGNIEGALMTANFKFQSIDNLDMLVSLQPDKPVLVTEYWPGWFDHWFETSHNTMSVDFFANILNNIFDYGGSVNFYMFHGGTNFGFMNGGNVLGGNGIEIAPYYTPTVTSYDYDAPLTESGDYTPKYDRAAEMIADYDPLASVLSKPPRPALIAPSAYVGATMNQYLNWEGILANIPSQSIQSSEKLLSMEQLSINNGNGQSYGYINYRKQVSLHQGSILTVRGYVRDLLQVLINGVMVNPPVLNDGQLSDFGAYGARDSSLVIDLTNVPGGCTPDCTLDLFVENLGRANFGNPHHFDQKKGLWQGDVIIDGETLENFEIYALEFKSSWVQGLTGWQNYDRPSNMAYGPRVLRGEFFIVDPQPTDTYFDFGCSSGCQDWLHGAVFINGFNIGRYYQPGPQKTLYIPGPLLQEGTNEIVIMENYLGGTDARFTNVPNYGPTK